MSRSAFPVAMFAICFGPEWAVLFVFTPFVSLLSGVEVPIRIITSQLHPTSSRTTAMGWETLTETLGAALGFPAAGWRARHTRHRL